MTDTSFILADRFSQVSARGSLRRWDSIDTARRDRSGAAVVGAVSFDPDTPDVLWQPEFLDICSAQAFGRTVTASPALAAATLTRTEPAPDVHRTRVADVVALIRGGAADKVVIGRSETLRLDPPLDPVDAFEGFRRTDPAGNGYLVDIGTGWLVGSSPELLISRRGLEVEAFPLAGTRPRDPEAAEGADPGAGELLASAKDRAEHDFVTRALADALAPLCSEIDIPEEPVLVAAPTTWHLGTPIRARLTDAATSVLDLVARVHPTPAVCGSPDIRALDIIRAVEGRGARGFFGGAVGYCDDAGDGSFRVTIRGAVLNRDGRGATAWAGGGLTAHSDPDHELAETVVKLARARQGLRAGAATGAGTVAGSASATATVAATVAGAVR